MINLIKRYLISALLATTSIGSVFLFSYWRQATQLPSWYTQQAIHSTPVKLNRIASIDQAIASSLSKSAQPTRQSVSVPHPSFSHSAVEPSSVQFEDVTVSRTTTERNQKRAEQDTPEKNINVALEPGEVNTLFSSALHQKAIDNKLAPAVKGVNTTMQGDVIESGAVLNLSELPIEQLPSSEKAFFEKLLAVFPDLGKREVYIGMAGKPTVKNGQIQLDDNTQIKLGNLSFSISELAQRLGVSDDQIRDRLLLAIQFDRLNVKKLQLSGNTILLHGSTNP